MLTRKHFIAAAKQAAANKTLPKRRKAVADFIRFARNTGSMNPRFDRKRFKDAANANRAQRKR